jgi:hypothetical protein
MFVAPEILFGCQSLLLKKADNQVKSAGERKRKRKE